MKYRSFATLAAALAMLTMAGGHPTTASAKAEMTHASAVQAQERHAAEQAAAIVVAQAERYGEPASSHMEARPVPAQNDGHTPFDPLALGIAGFAVMASLALRRSPNK